MYSVCYRKRSACVVLGLHLARNIALACCSCTRSHCIALLWVRNTLDSITLGLQRMWIASHLRLHCLELHHLELRCFERTAVALAWIAGRAVNRWVLHRLDCNAWIAMLGLHGFGLHLDWDCITWTCVALNVLQLHLFAWQSRNGCICWANQSLWNGVCSRSIGGALGTVVGLLGLCDFGAKSELVA